MKSKIILFCVGILLIIGFATCKKETKSNGFTLQRFKVINSQLSSIISGIKDSANMLREEGDVIVLELRMMDSIPEFCLTSESKNEINKFYIYNQNQRIVGFIEDKRVNSDIIVVSEINNIYDFENTFYKFLIPTKDKKYFEYIFFPDDQYTVDKNGHGGEIPVFHDPCVYYYYYKDAKINYLNYRDSV